MIINVLLTEPPILREAKLHVGIGNRLSMKGRYISFSNDIRPHLLTSFEPTNFFSFLGL